MKILDGAEVGQRPFDWKTGVPRNNSAVVRVFHWMRVLAAIWILYWHSASSSSSTINNFGPYTIVVILLSDAFLHQERHTAHHEQICRASWGSKSSYTCSCIFCIAICGFKSTVADPVWDSTTSEMGNSEGLLCIAPSKFLPRSETNS